MHFSSFVSNNKSQNEEKQSLEGLNPESQNFKKHLLIKFNKSKSTINRISFKLKKLKP